MVPRRLSNWRTAMRGLKGELARALALRNWMLTSCTTTSAKQMSITTPNQRMRRPTTRPSSCGRGDRGGGGGRDGGGAERASRRGGAERAGRGGRGGVGGRFRRRLGLLLLHPGAVD